MVVSKGWLGDIGACQVGDEGSKPRDNLVRTGLGDLLDAVTGDDSSIANESLAF